MDEAARATQRWDAQSGPPETPVAPPRPRSLLERGYASLPDSAITRLLTRGEEIALSGFNDISHLPEDALTYR